MRFAVCRGIKHCGVISAQRFHIALLIEIRTASVVVHIDVFCSIRICFDGGVKHRFRRTRFKLFVDKRLVRRVFDFGLLLDLHGNVVKYYVMFRRLVVYACIPKKVSDALGRSAKCHSNGCPRFILRNIHFSCCFRIRLNKSIVLFGGNFRQVAADCHACMTNLRRIVGCIQYKALHTDQTHAKRDF